MPKGHWLWGNVFDIDKAIEQFHKWQKEYGDIYRLNMGGLKVIMVNQLKYLSYFKWRRIFIEFGEFPKLSESDKSLKHEIGSI